jgi:surface antigen
MIALLGAISSMALTAGPSVALTPSANPGDYGYPYPNAPDCNEQTGANCIKDKWGFVQGQCHSWVAYRLNQLNAAQLQGGWFDTYYRQPSGKTWGSVANWDKAAAAAGITVNDAPALGSVAWWSTDGGHVGYVEAVNADGSVSMSEMNFDFHNGFRFTTLTRGQRWPTGFIHIADRPAGSAVPNAPTNLIATAASHRVRVRWQVPADNGSPISGYTVTATPGGRSVTVAAGRRAGVVTHLQNGTSYTFRVHATNANGNSAESAPSNAVVPG